MPRVWQGKGRIWLLLGIAVGIAVGVGKLAYFAGAATSLSDTAERIVGTGGRTLVHAAASHGASLRVVDGITAVLTVLVPGVTALLLMYAARGTLRLRAVTGVLVAALGVAAFFYLPHGVAAGVAVLAFAAAGIALVSNGAACRRATRGTCRADRNLRSSRGSSRATAHFPTSLSTPCTRRSSRHAGSPLWLRVVVLALAALPFALAARLVVR